jgi:LysR family transcriptional activator of mexEF-oprN operon
MANINHVYGRDLDLNLLRVFAVVAETGSVTTAASRLYLTQPAVSAALRRLGQATSAELFVRKGRALALTERGQRLRDAITSHLSPLVEAAFATPTFDAQTSERTLRLGFSDTTVMWVLPRLLRRLESEAPMLRLIVVPVQFRTVGAALASGLDAAVTVADEMPNTILRRTLQHGGFVCLFDPRHAAGRRLSKAQYFERWHVVVSYNADLRGVVEDATGKSRKVRCSVSGFAQLGAIIDDSALVATVPSLVAEQLRVLRPHLVTVPVPFALPSSPLELLWPAAKDDDPAGRFIRQLITELVAGERRRK